MEFTGLLGLTGFLRRKSKLTTVPGGSVAPDLRAR